jgi:putative flippase GtrA
MTLHKLVFRYMLFALLATLANLLAQRAVLSLDDTGSRFMEAVAIGTLTGLILKYILDKIWIFKDFNSGLKEHGRKVIFYMGTGIVTTALFWFVEAAFWLIWQTDLMREIGAVFGLSFGYVIKYRLDRRYVFTNVRLAKDI